jgi:F0F1-type ATP synthase membrane subunit b/b'
MASASFTLRAVDQTRAAFASVQNSLGRLEKQTMAVAKITKLAFGGEAIVGTLNMMRQRLDKVIESGEEMGFDDQQIATALQFEDAVNGILDTLTKIPLVLAKLGFDLGNAFSPLTKGEIEERVRRLKFDRAQKEILSTVEATKKLQDEFDLMGISAGASADEARRMATALFEQAVATFATNPSKGFQLQQQALEMLNRSKQGTIDLDKEIRQAQDELNKTLPESQRVGMSQADLIEGLRERYRSLTIEVTDLNTALAAYREVGGPVGETQDMLLKKIKEQSVVSAQLNKLLDEQGKIAQEAGQITSGAFENAILSGEKLRDTMRALAQDLIRLLFRQQITEPLAKNVGSFFTGLFAGRATGGPVTGNTPYIVGERGPELFIPTSSGNIIPNSAMRSSGGAPAMGGVTVNYNIAAGVTRGELLPILEAERKRLKAEIPDMVRRGGSYRAAFA